jgi:hypothetical protein
MVNKTPSPTFAMMGDCFASGGKITDDIYPIEISNQVNKRYQKKKIKIKIKIIIVKKSQQTALV